jgi:hypothetical protein
MHWAFAVADNVLVEPPAGVVALSDEVFQFTYDLVFNHLVGWFH